MLSWFPDRVMKRYEWKEVRTAVRRHALINSQQALEKRALLSEKKVLMGGIVVKKQDMAVILSDENSTQYQARCAVPVDRAIEQMEQEIASGASPVLEGAGSNLLIYDFSGVFEVNGSLGDFDRDLRRKMYQIKEGDTIFVSGEVVSMNSPAGYHIQPSNFYSEDEILFYRMVCPQRYEESRRELCQIKEKVFSEPSDETLVNARYPWDVVKLFLNRSHLISKNDYFWLETAAKAFFDKTEDVRAAQLVLKYYLVHVREEATRYIGEGHGSYPVDVKELFFDLYPNLQGIVDWPQQY